jgi:hypothetical protein
MGTGGSGEGSGDGVGDADDDGEEGDSDDGRRDRAGKGEEAELFGGTLGQTKGKQVGFPIKRRAAERMQL